MPTQTQMEWPSWSILIVNAELPFSSKIRSLPNTNPVSVMLVSTVKVAENLVKEREPNLLLLDMKTPNAMQLVRYVQENHKAVKVVEMSDPQENDWIPYGLEVGTTGYFLYLLSELLLYTIVQSYLTSTTQSENIPLTARNIEVLQLIARGHRHQDIADQLYIQVSTVKAHCRKICESLEAENIKHAIAIAIRIGLIQP